MAPQVTRKEFKCEWMKCIFKWNVAAKLLLSYKVLHKLPEVDGSYIS